MNNGANIYLIGMMGSGKTVTGKDLAERLNYTFVDLDAEIQAKEGRSIPEIFAGSGEPYFRDVESSVLEHFSKKNGQVIATGGGIVLREENVRITGVGPNSLTGTVETLEGAKL